MQYILSEAELKSWQRRETVEQTAFKRKVIEVFREDALKKAGHKCVHDNTAKGLDKILYCDDCVLHRMFPDFDSIEAACALSKGWSK